MRFLISFIFLLFTICIKAQSYNFINYTPKDGLAGSTVYTMCQDKDGFMWFGTENGLSRFDGTHFKNFTIKDGLPDNEVIKVYPDSKGRVWIGTFSKEICYYYAGKIYNTHNNSLLKDLKLDNNIEGIYESSYQYICISTRKKIILITPQDSILRYNKSSIYFDGTIDGSVFEFYGKIRFGIISYFAFDFNPKNGVWQKIYLNKSGKKKNYTPDFAQLLYDSISDSYLTTKSPDRVLSGSPGSIFFSPKAKYINTVNGTWLVDTIHLKLSEKILDGIKISQSIEDNEGNTWFASLGSGIYKLASLNIKTLLYDKERKKRREVFSIVKHNHELIIGNNNSQFFIIDSSLKPQLKNLHLLMKPIIPYFIENKLYSMVNMSPGETVFGFDGCVGKYSNQQYKFKYLGGPVKSVEKINDSSFIAGTGFYAFKIRLKDLAVTDTIWRERCTKVFYNNGNYYIGTLAGLYEVKEDKSYYYLGNLHPILTRRIMDIKKDHNGVLWVSTSDKGIIGIKDRKIVKIIDDSIGLSSNNAKTLFVKNNYLWVGTNNGICKVNIANNTSNEIVKYSMSDGLPSNNINALYVDDSMVWVGSPEGLTYFREKDIAGSSMCNLKLTEVTVAGTQIPLDSSYKLHYKNNDIRFEYAGISFRSGGELTYYYRLNGLNGNWETTDENILDYKTLPPGNYKLELYAVNKYGVKSNTITISISVDAPFWKTLWFYTLVTLTIIGVLVYVLNRRNKKTQQKLEESNRLQKQFAALEQQALQSQMNPHFIFNCLNSIQQYVLTNNTEKANLYLTEFAYLIRQTLHISSQKTITLKEEIEYLTRYINMELMRFGNNFTYSIQTKNITNTTLIEIPSLLIQPFVENSLRHGIRHLTNRQGKIEIEFSLHNHTLLCHVKDNGVGRVQAEKFKSSRHIEYQSKGMKLTEKRIELLNTLSEKKILLTVTDLKDNNNVPAGTLVELIIPL